MSRTPVCPMDSVFYGIGVGIKRVIGETQDWLFWFKDFECKLYCEQSTRAPVGAAVLAKCGDAAFLERFERELKRCGAELVAQSKKFVESTGWSDERLARELEEYGRLANETYTWGVLPNLLDYASDEVDNPLLAKLDAYLKTRTRDAKQTAVWMKDLTTPDEESFPNAEHKEFLELTIAIGKNKALVEAMRSRSSKEINALAHEPRFARENSLVNAHAAKWEWLSFLFMGPVKWTKHYFLHRLRDALRQHDADLKGELASLRALPDYVRRTRKQAFDAVRPDAEHAMLFEAARKMMFFKSWRKDMQVHSYYYLARAIREVGRRFSLPQELVYCMTLHEITTALRGESDAPEKKELEERKAECGLVVEKGVVRVVVGDELRRITAGIRKEEVRNEDVQKIKGTCACPGHAFGTVRVVNKAEEMSKMQRGDVLVSQMTNPEIVIAMKRAAAIVTDFGGLTCHAAIVSRELGVPCVVGTRVATKVLKDGDRVAVNATIGEVTKA